MSNKFFSIWLLIVMISQLNASIFGSEEIETLKNKNNNLIIKNKELESTFKLSEQQKKADLDSIVITIKKEFAEKIEKKNQLIMECNNSIEKLKIKLSNKEYEIQTLTNKKNSLILKSNKLIKYSSEIKNKNNSLLIKNKELEATFKLNEQQNKANLDSKEIVLKKEFEKQIQEKNQKIMEKKNIIEKLQIKLNTKEYQNDKKFNEKNKDKIKNDVLKKYLPYVGIFFLVSSLIIIIFTRYYLNKAYYKTLEEEERKKEKLAKEVSRLKNEIENITRLHKKKVDNLEDKVEKSTKNHIIDYIKELKEKRDRNIGLLK